MKKILALTAIVAALGACEKAPKQNPELLKGSDFVTMQNETPITLSFDAAEMRISGKAVNRYNGSYEATGNKIKFGPMMSTMMAGPENAMKAEQEYFKFMATAETYDLSGSVLTIKGAEGAEIKFEKVANEQE